MSYQLNTVIDALDGSGLIITDDKLVVETLNESFGINVHHDLVVTSDEINKLKNVIGALNILALADGDEFLLGLVEKVEEIFE